MKKKICVITGSRAEYGLLRPLIKKISLDEQLDLSLVATGMHLSSEFGLTYKEIEEEFHIDHKIEMLLSSDTKVGISKSMGLATISFSDLFEKLKPDFVVVLGDRYEIFSAVSAALIFKIPVGHIHGGEKTEGAFDDALRHCITKMSHLHFTSTEQYRQRVIQLGEKPQTVFNVGSLGVESIKELKLLNKEQFEESINFKLNKKNILVTFHPTTLDDTDPKIQFQNVLNALEVLHNTNIIFTKTNSDTSGRIINEMIDSFVSKNNRSSIAFHSLGQLRYLSSLQFVDSVIGNSSSGIIEAPSFKISTINIGDRQKGRIKAKSVLDCKPDKEEIFKTIKTIYTNSFTEMLKNIKNPYEKRNTSSIILDTIKNADFKSLIKKSFYDFNIEKNI